MPEQNTNNSRGSLFDLEHEILKNSGNPIVVCVGHFCDLDGISKQEYEKRKGEQDG